MIVAGSVDVTKIGVTVKVAVVAPPAIFIEAGTVAALTFELLSVTVPPMLGAGPPMVTVAVTVPCDPPITEDWDNVND